MQHFICKKGVILSNNAQNCFFSGFISENTNLGFMLVDIRTAFTQYLKEVP